MNFLCADTSTDAMTLRINRGDQHFAFDAVGAAKSSDLIISQCLQGLASLGLQWHDLTALVYNQGPGSFTGLRTSCAVLQGFSLVHALPSLGFSSLLVLAQQALVREPQATKFLCVLDARMGEIYWATYEWAQGSWITHIGPQVGTGPLVHASFIEQHPKDHEQFWLVGHTHLEALKPLSTHRPTLHLNPHAQALFELASLYCDEGRVAAWGHTGLAMPLYVRNQVAQTTLERQQAKTAI
jgi:tRNA threonylcarbamoyladenosine biosynthesis protein TsaB